MNFHHAGIATNDAAALADRYAALFDAPIVHEERFDGMAVSFLDLGSGYFELLEPHETGRSPAISTATAPGSTILRSAPPTSRPPSRGLPSKASTASTTNRALARGATRSRFSTRRRPAAC